MSELLLKDDMKEFNPELLKQLYIPASDSHKSQNGKVMLIAGSKLFHAASIWPLSVMSRICDMVFYASTTENNEIVAKMKEQFLNGIVIPRDKIGNYIEEAEAILIGPGLTRTEEKLKPTEDYDLKNLEELDDIVDDGVKTYYLTKHLLKKYQDKKWIIDGGSLQMMSPEWLLDLSQTPILTPHKGEFLKLFGLEPNEQSVSEMARKYNCVILSKGEVDIVAAPTQTVIVKGGNSGMTKGGTGDVLAGLTAALYSKNDAFISACSASYINKKAGESLEKSMGLYFNATDLANQIPLELKRLL